MNASGRTVTLVSASVGSLGGTLTATTDKNGLATFSNFTLSQSGTVTISISSSGLTSTTFSLNVLNETIGAPCALEDSLFETGQGGCRDKTSGLVWGSVGTTSILWYTAIWDSTLAGAPVVDSGDYGRTHDYAENLSSEDCGTFCDNSSNTTQTASLNTIGYCKSLNEGGQTDWRVPSKAELLSLYNNGSSSHISGSLARWFWTSSSLASDKTYAHSIRLSDGANMPLGKNTIYNANVGYTSAFPICVRGGRTNISKLAVVSAPTIMGMDGTTTSTFQIKLMDSLNNNAMASGITVTVSSSSGTLSGATTAVTNYQGTATFNPFSISGASGTVTFTFSAPGLTSTTTSVNLRTGVGIHICAAENSRFKSQYGGCHDSDTDLAWSSPSTAGVTWHQAIWDSLSSGSPATDATDYGRVNDYDSAFLPTAGNYDSSATAYCKSLTEAGYSDWRVPTRDEWENVRVNNLARTYFSSTIIPLTGGAGSGCYWSSSTLASDPTQAYYIGLWSTGSLQTTTKTSSTTTGSGGTSCDNQSSSKNIRVVCVRDNSP